MKESIMAEYSRKRGGKSMLALAMIGALIGAVATSTPAAASDRLIEVLAPVLVGAAIYHGLTHARPVQVHGGGYYYDPAYYYYDQHRGYWRARSHQRRHHAREQRRHHAGQHRRHDRRYYSYDRGHNRGHEYGSRSRRGHDRNRDRHDRRGH
jgi:hypothetical protein